MDVSARLSGAEGLVDAEPTPLANISIFRVIYHIYATRPVPK